MVTENMDFLESYDAELGAAVRSEYARQCRNIELIASENVVSPAVMAAMGTVLTNKYAEGYPGKRYYGGCEWWKTSRAIAHARCSARSMPMFSRTAARRRTWRSILRW